ncbi:hypothetical protein [Sphingobacterium mizutaii]|uniref:hypothetical protein n=1 Tax=Sphingobacterium mizutaii TaxID=1010 RepID=UPI00162A7630|nr:hypothetical protein [Sphingobacterium mizutaii]
MIIQVENIDYLLVSSDKKGISIDFNTEDLPVIYAPADLSIQELTAYVKRFAKKEQKKSMADEEMEFFTLKLFSKDHPVRPLTNGQSKPYLKNNIIYYSKSLFKSKNQERLEKQLRQYMFEQVIKTMIGKWEEILDYLLEDIEFKKLPKRYFVNSGNTLTYNKSNIELDLRCNEYLLAKALIGLAGKNKLQAGILERHFSDARQIEKILSYGNERI